MLTTGKCVRTGREIAIADGYLVGEPLTGEWHFIADDAPETGADYSIPIKDLIRSPAEFVDWMAHLDEKTWFRPSEFIKCFARIRNNA